MTQVDLSMKPMQEFAETLAKVSKNLLNSAGLYEDVVVPHAKESGSDVLNALAEDVVAVKEDLTIRHKSCVQTAQAMEEYVARMNKMHTN